MARQFEFKVVGRGDFPYDMLRHDSAWPATPEDASKLATSNVRRVVHLYSVQPLGTPSVGRWDSFGWQAVAPSHSAWQPAGNSRPLDQLEVLKLVRDRVAAEKDVPRLSMGAWGHSENWAPGYTPDDPFRPVLPATNVCQTAGCLAGTVVAVLDPENFLAWVNSGYGASDIEIRARQLLGIDRRIGGNLFLPPYISEIRKPHLLLMLDRLIALGGIPTDSDKLYVMWSAAYHDAEKEAA